MPGNFHLNSDIDLLYMQRNLGGSGLQQIQRVFESQIFSITQYLQRNRNTNIAYIYDEEKDNLIETLRKPSTNLWNRHQSKTVSKHIQKQ